LQPISLEANVTIEVWLAVQEQLWLAFHPFIEWWLAFMLAGFVAAGSTLFAVVFLAEWLNG
jgi:hypothetical protein